MVVSRRKTDANHKIAIFTQHSLHLFVCLRIKRLSTFRVPVTMAVPKKKTSKSKRDKRRATWRRKAAVEAQKALSLGKSILSGRSKFVYPNREEEEE